MVIWTQINYKEHYYNTATAQIHRPVFHLRCASLGNLSRISSQFNLDAEVVEVHQFDKYTVQMDGSGLPTNHNRRFLRKFFPAVQKTAHRRPIQDFKYIQPTKLDGPKGTPQSTPRDIPTTPDAPTTPIVNPSRDSIVHDLPVQTPPPPPTSGDPGDTSPARELSLPTTAQKLPLAL
eukprot:TCONS_00034079-protein